MKITEEMVDRFAEGWERANREPMRAPGARRWAGLEAVFAPMHELEKHPRCRDKDGDVWFQRDPEIWSLNGDRDDMNMTTSRLLAEYGPCEGFGTW